MTGEKSNGNGGLLRKLTVGELITISIVIAGFVSNFAVRNVEMKDIARRVEKIECAMAAQRVDFYSDLTKHSSDTRVHYMIASPVQQKLDNIESSLDALTIEVSEIKTLVRSSRRQP